MPQKSRCALAILVLGELAFRGLERKGGNEAKFEAQLTAVRENGTDGDSAKPPLMLGGFAV
jgi:hypothetical protein